MQCIQGVCVTAEKPRLGNPRHMNGWPANFPTFAIKKTLFLLSSSGNKSVLCSTRR